MAAIATTERNGSPCDVTVGEPSSLMVPSALASHRLTVGESNTEMAGRSGVVVDVVDVEVVLVDVDVVLVEVVVAGGSVVEARDMPPVVVGTVTPRRLCAVGVVVVVDESVEGVGCGVLEDGTVVVEDVADPGCAFDNVEAVVVDAGAVVDWTCWALAASGASTASTPAAAPVNPIDALSDQTTVRASFWTI